MEQRYLIKGINPATELLVEFTVSAENEATAKQRGENVGLKNVTAFPAKPDSPLESQVAD